MSETIEPNRKKQKMLPVEETLIDFSSIAVNITALLRSSEQTATTASDFWNRNDCRLLLDLVFRELDIVSVITCCYVCKLWKDCASQSSVWHALYAKYFGSNKTLVQNWKTSFIQEYLVYPKEDCFEASRQNVFLSARPKDKFVPPVICFVNFPLIEGCLLKDVCIYENLLFGTSVDLAAYDMRTSKKLWNIHSDALIAQADAKYVYTRFKYPADYSYTVNKQTGKEEHRRYIVIGKYKKQLIAVKKNNVILVDLETGKEEIVAEFCIVPAPDKFYIHEDKVFFYDLQENEIHMDIISLEQKSILFSTLVEFDTYQNLEHAKLVTWKNRLAVTSGALEFPPVLQVFEMDYLKKPKLLWKFEDFLENFEEGLYLGPLYHHEKLWMLYTKPVGKCVIIGFDANTGEQLYAYSFQSSGDIVDLQTSFDECLDQTEVFFPLCFYILDNFIYYGVFNVVHSRLHVGAISTQTGTVVWKQNIQCPTAERRYQLTKQPPIYHPHIKAVLRCVEQGVVMMWHP